MKTLSLGKAVPGPQTPGLSSYVFFFSKVSQNMKTALQKGFSLIDLVYAKNGP